MNRKMVFYTTGKIICITALLMVLPAVVSLIYGELSDMRSFLLSIGIADVLGCALLFLCKPKDRVIYAKEGFIIVSLAWLSLSALGALPFLFSGINYTDAFFETVSGFTTTGATVINDVAVLGNGLLFWRSFTHWIGGMGVLVFVMAFMPGVSDRSIHIMRAEMPGPIIGKLVPRARDTAKILYYIYIALTALMVIFLWCGDMSFFESVVHSLSTAGTGGFGLRNDSIASYSPYSQWVVAVFMCLFGVNFNLYYLMLIKRFRLAVKSRELWCYFAIILIASGIIFFNNLPAVAPDVTTTVRNSVFQVVSVITTTGFATVDVNLWPPLSKAVLLILMFVGGCAGSTAGGLKMARVMILFKKIRQELRRMLHPRSVNAVKFEGRTVEERTLDGVTTYFGLYMILLLATFLLLSFEPSFSLETNFSAAVSCFNNIGPIFSADASVSNFALYSPCSKWLLSFAMLFGRLEIYPLILTLSPSTWSKNK